MTAINILLLIICIPFALLIYLVLFGNKECYECGCKLPDEEPKYKRGGKNICYDCWKLR